MKLPTSVTIKSEATIRQDRIKARVDARAAHTRMYEKLLQRLRTSAQAFRPPMRPPEVRTRVESYELTYAELRVMLRGGRK